MSSLVQFCMEWRNIFLRVCILRGPADATARFFSFIFSAGRVPRPRARVTFGRSPKSDQKRCLKPQVSRLPARLGYAEKRSCRKSKNRWFLAAFLHPFATEGKRMSRRSAKYSRRRQTCRTQVQPAIEEQKTGRRDASPCGVRDRSREKRPAPGARNTFFTSYHKSAKDCNARSAFPAAGHCI